MNNVLGTKNRINVDLVEELLILNIVVTYVLLLDRQDVDWMEKEEEFSVDVCTESSVQRNKEKSKGCEITRVKSQVPSSRTLIQTLSTTPSSSVVVTVIESGHSLSVNVHVTS